MRLYIPNENPSMVFVYEDNDYQIKELRAFLTIKVPGAKYSKVFRNHQWDGTKKFFNYYAKAFPIGFLSRVMEKFPDAELVDQREYKPIKFHIPKLNLPNGAEMRLYQKEAVLHAFEHKNCLIQAATNAGKSAILAALVLLLREEKVVIVVHTIDLMGQLRGMLMDMTHGMNVGFVASGDVNLDKYVNIVMVKTLMNRLDTDPDIRDMFLGSRVLMVDECHHMQAATHSAVFMRSKAVYRFGCSGTIQPASTFDGWMMRQYIGDVVYSITNRELITQGISAEPIIYMIKHFHTVDYRGISQAIRDDDTAKGKKFPSLWKEREEVAKRAYAQAFRSSIIENEDRNKIIVDKVYGEYKDKQTLIVVDYLDHGKRIKDLIKKRTKDTGTTDMDFIHGQAETRTGSLQSFKSGNLRVLISSSIIDEGLDISRIQVLVLAGGKKSTRQILQRIGRGLRRKEGDNSVIIIDFFDLDNKYLEKHSQERLRIYNEQEFRVEIVDLADKLSGQVAA